MSWYLLQNPLNFSHFPKFLTCHCPKAHSLDSTICFSLSLSSVPSSPIICFSTEVGAACTVHGSTFSIPVLAIPVATQLCQTFWPPTQSFVTSQMPPISVLPVRSSHPLSGWCDTYRKPVCWRWLPIVVWPLYNRLDVCKHETLFPIFTCCVTHFDKITNSSSLPWILTHSCPVGPWPQVCPSL